MWIYFLPGIIGLGMITSIEDIRYSKIRNKWVILAIAYAMTVYAFLMVLGHQYINLIEIGTNLIFSSVVGFGLWYFRLWSAGDGKLFIAFSLLIPLSIYRSGYTEWVPSIALLVNIYIPALSLLLLSLLSRLRWRHIKEEVMSLRTRRIFPYDLIKSLPALFVIFWIMQGLLSTSTFGNNFLLTLILTLFAFMAVQKVLKDRAFVITLIISISRFIIDDAVYTLSFWFNFSTMIIIWVIIRRFIQDRVGSLGSSIFSREMSIKRLVPGMYLNEAIKKSRKKPNSEHIRYRNNYYYKTDRTNNSTESLIETDSVTDEQIKMLRDIGFRKIKVSQTIPFAPFIFLGTLITILVKGNILIFIRNLL